MAVKAIIAVRKKGRLMPTGCQWVEYLALGKLLGHGKIVFFWLRFLEA